MSTETRDPGALPDLARAMGPRFYRRAPTGVAPIANPDPRCALPVAMEEPEESEATKDGVRVIPC